MCQKARVIIFNGPPGSGKDFAVRKILDESLKDRCKFQNVWHLEFKSVLYELTAKLFLLSIAELKELNLDRNLKEVPNSKLLGKSPRQALQFVSESVVKPKMGVDFFGRAAAKNLKNLSRVWGARNFAFSDGGFGPEIYSIINLVGPKNLMIVQLFAEGCTFEGDTRDYIQKKTGFAGVRFEKVENCFGPRFAEEILELARDFYHE